LRISSTCSIWKVKKLMLGILVSLLLPSRAALAVTAARALLPGVSFCDDGFSRQLVTHHKAGSWMLDVAMQWINHAATLACTSAPDPVGLDWIGLAEFHQYMPWLSKPQLHVLHVVRNPFEVIASEYAYDLSDAEPTWMSNIAMVDIATDPQSNCAIAGEPFCIALR
jgi:hypothetical protein